MACNCKGRKNVKYHWTPPVGSLLLAMTYNTEIEAKAKVLRKGGTYVALGA